MLIEKIENYSNFYLVHIYNKQEDDYFFIEVRKSDLIIIKSYCTQQKEMIELLQQTVNKQRVRIKTGAFFIHEVTKGQEDALNFLKDKGDVLKWII